MLFNIFYEFFTVCTSVVAEDPSGKHVAGCGSLTELVIFVPVSYLSTHTVYWYNKIIKKSLWGGGGGGGVWPYWKMDTRKRNFHEVLLLF